MKKRFMSLILCGVLAVSAISLTACGGGSEEAVQEVVEEKAEEVKETVEEVAEDVSADYAAFTEVFTECYAGTTDDENTYAYLGFGEDIGALMFFSTDTKESGSFVGSYEIDEENGTITITDEDLGVTMTFGVTELDGGYSLDMGDIGTATVGSVSSQDFVYAMQAIDEETEPQF